MTVQTAPIAGQSGSANEPPGLELGALVTKVGRRWVSIVVAGLVSGALAYGVAQLLPKKYTARTTILPPQQQQSSAAAALASISSLATLGGGGGALKSPADQYVALMQSVTVMDRVIDQFKLAEVYDERYREDARKELGKNVRIGVGRKDGMIMIEVDDSEPSRAAAIANAHVDGLRTLTNTLAISEAQARRLFFEAQFRQSRDNLTKAQVALQGTGITQGALKAEPKSAAEGYARLRAQITSAEARLQSMRAVLQEGAPELAQMNASLAALRGELARTERQSDPGSDSDYIAKYREYKYQEALFELFARQYEMARVDESREGALVQVVDKATAPEKPSHPRPAFLAALATVIGMMVMTGVALLGRAR